MKKIAINGFGRIGSLLFRKLEEEREAEFEVVAVNDLAATESLAYGLKYDSVYRKFKGEVKVEGDDLVVNSRRVRVTHEAEPAKLPWGEMGIDLAVEATGKFESYGKAKAHLLAGAKRVVITAPVKDEEGVEGGRTVLMGVNEEEMEKTKITCNGSCTTNAAYPVIAVLDEAVGIQKAILNTVHGYTATQKLVDGAGGKDPRRGRAAAVNIIPATTGAAISVTRGLTQLAGKFDGVALRVPVVAGSVADITFVAKKETSREEVNEALRAAAISPKWQEILKVTEEPIVSSDIIGEPYGAVADLSFTRVVGGNLVKVLSWYDNEWGYVNTLARHIRRALK